MDRKIQNGSLSKKYVRGLDFHIVSNYTFFVFSIFQPIFFEKLRNNLIIYSQLIISAQLI